MLSAVGAKRLDSFNEALQHKYSARHALFLARALHPDQELWHTFCQLGVRGAQGVPSIAKIAKYAGAGCLAGADSRFRCNFHVAGLRAELAVRPGCRWSTYQTEVLDSCVFYPRQSWQLGKADAARPSPGPSITKAAGTQMTITLQRLRDSHARRADPDLPACPHVLL